METIKTWKNSAKLRTRHSHKKQPLQYDAIRVGKDTREQDRQQQSALDCWVCRGTLIELTLLTLIKLRLMWNFCFKFVSYITKSCFLPASVALYFMTKREREGERQTIPLLNFALTRNLNYTTSIIIDVVTSRRVDNEQVHSRSINYSRTFLNSKRFLITNSDR